MTERPTEQTHARLSGVDASSPASGAPTLQAERPDGAPDGTAIRPAVRAPVNGESSTAAPTAPAPAQDRPVLPPPPAELAEQPAPAAVTQAPAAPAAPKKARPTRIPKAKRPPRRARLRLTRIDPWSVMKTAFLLSIALGVVTIVSVLMVWSVLGAAGVWDSINTTVRDIVGDQADNPFTIQDYLGTDRVIGFTMLVAVIDVVLMTAIATLGAFLYNMAAALLGGIDITLVEDER